MAAQQYQQQALAAQQQQQQAMAAQQPQQAMAAQQQQHQSLADQQQQLSAMIIGVDAAMSHVNEAANPCMAIIVPAQNANNRNKRPAKHVCEWESSNGDVCG